MNSFKLLSSHVAYKIRRVKKIYLQELSSKVRAFERKGGSMNNKIGHLLDSLRIYGNQKETEAAELLGVSLSTWKRWVSGKETIPDSALKNYLAFCGFDYGRVSMRAIMTRIEEVKPTLQSSSAS
jgi:hypothetical protein